MTDNDSLKKGVEIERLKHTWEILQKKQKSAPYGKRNVSISSVKVVDDDNGKKVVQVRLSNGGKINDAGDKKDVFQSMIPKNRVNLGRLMSLVEAVRALGFAAVAMGLPPELKRALLQACQKCGIPLKVEKKQMRNRLLPQKKPSVNDVKKGSGKKSSSFTAKKQSSSFTVVTSPRSLDLAVRVQQKRNKEYTALRVKRCEVEAKEDFLTLCCQSSAAFSQKDGRALTDEEEKIRAFIKRYALKIDNANEYLSKNRDKILEKMSLSDLPEHLRQKCSEKQKRYKSICSARNKALEMAQMDLKKKYYQNNMPIDLSLAALVRLSASRLPPPKERNLKNLAKNISELSVSVKKSRNELKETLREKRKKIRSVLSGSLSLKNGKETSNAASQNVHRHNFIENAVVRKLLEKNPVVR